MKIDFLSSHKKDIPERNSEIKPYIKDAINRIKQGHFTKKEQAVLAAVLLLAASGTGYGAFIHAPLEQREALKAALKSTPAVAHAQKAEGSAYENGKYILKETEVEQTIANDIASDPNVEITSEEVLPDGGNSGLMNLVVDHYGSSDALSQYIETLQGVRYKLTIDSISYSKDPSNVESSSIRLSLPYEIVDNSLSSKTFESQASEATTPAAPETTVTPGTGEDRSSSSAFSGSNYYSGRPSTGSGWSPTHPSTPTTVTPSSSHPSSTATSKKTAKPAKPQVKPPSDTPPTTQETVYLAPALTQYSVFDAILAASTTDGMPITLEPITDRTVAKKDQILTMKFETPQKGEGTEEIKRVIHLDTGGFYLPKNGYEFSIDVAANAKTAGQYSLILANLEGNSKEVLASRKDDLGDGFIRVFFPLNGMDGTVRANQIRYTFTDQGSVQELIALRNVQVLSHEK